VDSLPHCPGDPAVVQRVYGRHPAKARALTPAVRSSRSRVPGGSVSASPTPVTSSAGSRTSPCSTSSRWRPPWRCRCLSCSVWPCVLESPCQWRWPYGRGRLVGPGAGLPGVPRGIPGRPSRTGGDRRQAGRLPQGFSCLLNLRTQRSPRIGEDAAARGQICPPVFACDFIVVAPGHSGRPQPRRPHPDTCLLPTSNPPPPSPAQAGHPGSGRTPRQICLGVRLAARLALPTGRARPLGGCSSIAKAGRPRAGPECLWEP
jgi:hypothetical protein